VGRLAVKGLFRVFLVAAAGLAAPAAGAQQGPPAGPGVAAKVSGTLTAIHADSLDDRLSPGRIVVGTQLVTVPSMVAVDLPGDVMTLQELFSRAPARCRAEHESGLVASDRCRLAPRQQTADAHVWTAAGDQTPRTHFDPVPTDEPPPTFAKVVAVRGDDGGLVATSITFTRTDASVWGAVTFVNEEEGYLRINGAFGLDEGGALLRINDPEGRQSVQRGTGCGAEGNCSPDVRFKANTSQTSVRFEAGYPACVPGGLGDACPRAIRPVKAMLDGNSMVPIVPGDHVTARGGFEVHDGVRVFWAHTLVVHTSPVADGR
jgi:hypothetical protein